MARKQRQGVVGPRRCVASPSAPLIPAPIGRPRPHPHPTPLRRAGLKSLQAFRQHTHHQTTPKYVQPSDRIIDARAPLRVRGRTKRSSDSFLLLSQLRRTTYERARDGRSERNQPRKEHSHAHSLTYFTSPVRAFHVGRAPAPG